MNERHVQALAWTLKGRSKEMWGQLRRDRRLMLQGRMDRVYGWMVAHWGIRNSPPQQSEYRL